MFFSTAFIARQRNDLSIESFIRYKITLNSLILVVFPDGNFNAEFYLNSTTGVLTVQKLLKGGSDYQLSIQAKDTYIPPAIATTVVNNLFNTT